MNLTYQNSKLLLINTIFIFGTLGLWSGLVGCESSNESVKDSSNSDDESNSTDSASKDDKDGDADNDDDICDETEFTITPKPVNLMILQDISGSIFKADNSGDIKWTVVKDSLKTLLNELSGSEVRFGYDIFPDEIDFNSCNVSNPVQLDCAEGNSTAIINHQWEQITTMAKTPLWNAMKNFTKPDYAPSFVSDEYNSYLLVISDGADSCGKGIEWGGGGSDVTYEDLAAVTLELRDADIRSFVIGFHVTPEEAINLNAIAAEGGTEFSEYLFADDHESLSETFNRIAESLVSCIFEIELANDVDWNKVNFYFIDADGNETVIPYDENCDANTGWRWVDKLTHTMIELCDEACTELQGGNVKEVRAEFGCPTILI